ncbi:MAG: LpxI family protein [Gemmobacter sp.]
MADTAVIAGTGALPGAVLRAMRGRAEVWAPEGLDIAVPARRFRFERLVPFLDGLRDSGVRSVVLAGAMRRPRLDPALFDPATAQMVPRMIEAMQAGDDATLRAVVALIEEAGLTVSGVETVAPDLLPGAGLLGRRGPGPQDERDAARAAAIVAALGAADVGQGAVVVQGLCLAVEALPGTDAMLAQVAALDPALRPDPGRGRGLFYKAPKPGQDRRVDLPALGPATVAAAAAAGLGGIAWEAGGVLLLDRAETVAAADAAGLYLWARAP